MFPKLITSMLNRAILAAFFFIAAVLPSQALQSGDFTYTATATEVTISGYTGAGGVVTIPSSIARLPVTIVGDQAFYQYSGLTSVMIPDSVYNIGNSAFSQCTGLTSVTIGNGVRRIGDSAFSQCTGLTNLTIPSNVTIIGGVAFRECTGLTSVTIPSGVYLGNGVFSGCTGLTSVTIPNGVGSIPTATFHNCTGLTSVTIPDSVSQIGELVFTNCTGLTSVYFQGNAPTAGGGWNNTPATVYYTVGTTGWGPTFAGRPTQAVVASITSQPVNVTTLQGTRATFAVTAIGAGSYQWQKNGVNIPLATNSTLILSNVQQADATNYAVIVSNLVGYVTSDTVSLTVLPDSDLDGLSDEAEVTYGTNLNHSDSDGDGLSDRAEIQVYLSNPLLKDTDGDGFEDGFEVSTGFNPAQASSSPDSVSTIGNAVGFRFNAGLGMSYRIEDSSDLQNWTTLETPIIGAGGVVTRFYFTEGQPKRYFRVRKN